MINRQPLGLLGFLGIKNTGRAPDQLANTLAPTWDLEEQYCSTNAEFATAQLAIAADGYRSAFQVPQGQFWKILGFGAFSATLVAAEVLRLVPAMTDQAQVFIVPLPDASETNIVAQRAACALSKDLILSSGDTLGLLVAHFASAGNIQVFCNVRFARMT